jgi:hypothetical protein
MVATNRRAVMDLFEQNEAQGRCRTRATQAWVPPLDPLRTRAQIHAMDGSAWIIAAVGAAVGIVLAVVLLRRAKIDEPKPDVADYRSFFVIGLVMLGLGIGLGALLLVVLEVSWVIALPLVTVGLVFLAIGAGNRDKWSTD